MEAKPIVQDFLGHPVRVFRTEFQVEMTPRNTGSSSEIGSHNETQSPFIFTFPTLAIPFPDFCRGIGQREQNIRRMIQLSEEVFAGLWRVEQIPDALGRMRPTILMAQEMVDGLIMKLHTSRIQDEATRQRVIEFQRFVMFTLSLIRRRKILPIRDTALAMGDIPEPYRNMLTMKSSTELATMVKAQAAAEGKCKQTIYSKLNRYRGGNVITATGRPRKRRLSKITE